MANAFAKGECGVFANSLKRIGKWRRLAFATGFANSLKRMANGQPSLMLADKARSLPLSKKTGLAICHFASALKSAKPVANAPHSPEIKASYCEIF
jgi:hypothetical protein